MNIDKVKSILTKSGAEACIVVLPRSSESAWLLTEEDLVKFATAVEQVVLNDQRKKEKVCALLS